MTAVVSFNIGRQHKNSVIFLSFILGKSTLIMT
jgi:hypothetical protein